MTVSKTVKQAFGKRVAELREQRELTQMQLGTKIGKSGTCIWNWEVGNTFPRSPTLAKLAHALGTTVEYLSSGIGSPISAKPSVSASRPLAEVITETRKAVASAAGVPVSNVRVLIDYGD